MELTEDTEIKKLYETFRKPLLRFIERKVRDRHIAEEILGDVFIKAYGSLDSLKEKSSVKSWLYAIASNRIIDYYRKNGQSGVELVEENLADEEETQSVFKEFECCLDEFFDRLPKPNADALKAVYLKEIPQKEYAEMNDLNLSTVKSHIHRGKKMMKTFFEQCCYFEKDRHQKIIDYKRKDTK